MIKTLILAALVLFAGGAEAQIGRAPWQAPALSRAPSYAGPGDVVSGAYGWWGLRAYSKSYASGNGKIVLVKRPDATTQQINSLTNGKLDTASAISFAGTDATCTGTISGTTMTISSCASGTLRLSDGISGAGITGPAYITAIGSCASPPGTCTLNAAQTVSVATTITATAPLTVSTIYDQSGNARDMATPNTAALLVFNCINTTLPCLAADANHSGANYFIPTPGATQAQPITFTQVAIRTGHFTSYQPLLNQFDGTSAGISYYFLNAANTFDIFAGTNQAFAMSDSAWHILNTVFNGGSSVASLDGANATLGGSPGTNGILNTVGIKIGLTSFGSWIDAQLAETGLWVGGFTGPQLTSMCHNQYVYWATATSC